MSRVTRTSALFVACLTLASAASGLRQEPDPAHVQERQRAYLARSPYNDVVFDQLVESAANGHGLGALVDAYRISARTENAALVVLARLLARGGELDEARALLRTADAGADLSFLSARLALEGADYDGVLDALAELPTLDDPALVRDHAELAGRAHLGRGDRELAAEALLGPALVSEERDAALDAAELLERHGLLDEAADAHRLALERAGADPELMSASWIALGDLEARRFELAAAIEAYRAADDLLGRSHWRKPEIAARLGEWHQRAGTLDAWIESLRAASEDAPRDVGRREAWARALARSERLDEALLALAPALEEHPGDLALARLRIGWLIALEDDDALLTELQRVTAEHPRERDLGAQLAARLARSGRMDAADRRYAALFEAFPEDLGLRRDAAREWAALGETTRAAASFELALALAPLDVPLVRELVLVLDGDQRRDAADAALDAARARVEALPPLVVELARVQLDLQRVTQCRASLLELLQRVPDAHGARILLAEVELGRGDAPQARRLLRAVIGGTRDGRLRAEASTAYLSSFTDRKERREEVEREREFLARRPDDAAAPLVLELLLASIGDRQGAARMLARAVEQRPDDLALREDLMQRWRRLGNWQALLAQLAELELRAPERARLYRAQRIDALRHLGREQEALDLLASLEAGARRVPQAALDVADAFAELGAPLRALNLLEAALGWHPRNTDLRRALAKVQFDLGRETDAARSLVRAYRDATADRSDEVVAQLANTLQRGDKDRAQAFLTELVQIVEANPFDLPGQRLAIGLLMRRRDQAGAKRLLDGFLSAHPDDLAGLQLRARLAIGEKRHADAARDLERLRELDRGFGAELELLDCYLWLGDPAPAFLLAAEVDEPLTAARLLAEHGLDAEAADFLAQRMRGRRGSVAEWRWLADTRRALGNDAAAIDAYEELERAGGADADVYFTLAELRHAQGDLERCLHALRALMRQPDCRSHAQEFLESRRMWGTYDQLLAENVSRDPLDAAAIGRALRMLETRQHPESGRAALAALAEVRAATLELGRTPHGRDEQSWDAWLHDQARMVLMFHASLSQEKLSSLRTGSDRGETLTAEDWVDFAILASLPHALEPGDWERLERGRLAHPDSLRLTAATAQLAEARGASARALSALSALEVLVDARADTEQRALAAACERQERLLRERLEALGVEYDEAGLARAARFANSYAGLGLGAHLKAVTRTSVTRRRAVQHAIRRELDEARALLLDVRPTLDDALSEWFDHARALADAPGLAVEAEAFGLSLVQHFELAPDEFVVSGEARRWDPLRVRPTRLAPDEVVALYEEARRENDSGACLRIALTDRQVRPLATAFAHRGAIEASDADEQGRGEAYNAWVQAAELFGWAGMDREAVHAWTRAAALVRAPVEALTEAALAAHRRRTVQSAVSLMTYALAAHAERHANDTVRDDLLTPLPYRPLYAAENNYVRSRRWLLQEIGERLDERDPYCLQVLLVSFLLDSGDHAEAVRVLDEIGTDRELPWNLEWDLWGLLCDDLEGALPSPHDVELARAFVRQIPTNPRAQALYLSLLIDAGDHARAREVLDECDHLRFPNLEHAEALLSPLAARLDEASSDPWR